MAGLNLNINGDARRAQQALNDVATGSERAARITDQLARSFDHLENEAEERRLAPPETKALVEGHAAYEGTLRAVSVYLDGGPTPATVTRFGVAGRSRSHTS